MKCYKFIKAFVLAGVLCASVVHAQEQQPQQSPQQQTEQQTEGSGKGNPQSGAQPTDALAPIQPTTSDETTTPDHAMPVPAGRALVPPYESLTQETAQEEPDTHTLSGGETFGLGSLLGFRSLFDPALHFSQSGDTGIVAGHTDTVTSFGGSLALKQGWEHYRLTVVYRGAKTIYHPDSTYDQEYHDLNLAQSILGGRWTVRMRDNMRYSPQSTFGGFDTGGPGFYGAASLLSNIQSSLESGDSILTGRARRLNNTALGEVDYALSRRTTMTFTASYGLLHFLDPGYIDSHQVNGRVGYDYAISPRDTISLMYSYGRTGFNGNPRSIDSHTIRAAFGRKITGRLAFQVEAGPQLIGFSNFETTTPTKLSWNLQSRITYGMRLTTYSLSYSHGVTNGSGVFYGAQTNTIMASVNHRFTRFWSGALQGGYALNSNLTSGSGGTGRFNRWFGGINAGRQMGRHLRLSLSYGFQRQNASGVVCQVASCGTSRLRQVFGVTIQWHPLATDLYE